MSIFAKIRGAKKAADEHRKSVQIREQNVPKTPCKHVPTHAQTDALRIVQPNNEVLRDQIKEQHKRRSELGPIRSGSDLLTSHAVYRRQNSTASLGDISIASMLLQPPPANALPPLKPVPPSKMNSYRYSGFHPSARSRPAFTTSPSAASLSKGKSPLSTMTNSLNELPEEGLPPEDSPVESSKQSTKSLSSSSSEGLEIRYSTPGQSFAQTSAPHTRATSVASRADSPKSRRPLQTDTQHADELQRSKSPVHVFPSPIPERAPSPRVFDAELEADKTHHGSPDRLADQRMSTPISHASTITPTATSKRTDDEWLASYSSQHSTPTPRKGGKNFSRPTVVQAPNPTHLELSTEQDELFERLDLEIPLELISVGHVSGRAEIQPPEKSHARKANAQSSYGIARDTQIPRPIERQAQQPQKFQFSQNTPQAKQPRQDPYHIPYPSFSPRDTVPAERQPVRTAYSSYSQGQISHRQSQQSQQHHIPVPETFAQRQFEVDLEHERNEAYQQLSANDPSQHRVQSENQYFLAQDNFQITSQEAPPVPMASKPGFRMNKPTIRPITYTQVVTPRVNSSQQFETASPMTSPRISPTRSPMMSPVQSPVINPVKGRSGRVGIFGRRTPNTEEASSSRTQTPQLWLPPQPVENKKDEKRKSRNLLKKRGLTKAS